MALLLGGCGTTSVLVPAAETPAAIGSIRAKLNGNNTLLTLSAEHLAHPTRLAPSLTTYLVWIRPSAGGDFHKMGQLLPDAAGRASFETASTWRDVEVLVTAEETSAAQRPGTFVVLKGYASPRE
jgi:hypothetical protein